MKSLGRKFLVAILLSSAFVLDSFFGIIGVIAITYGSFLIYRPAGFIVGGFLLILASEISAKSPPPTPNGGEV